LIENLNPQEESGFHQHQYSTSKDFNPKIVFQGLGPITKSSDFLFYVHHWILILSPPDPSKDQVKKRGGTAQTKVKSLLDRFIVHKEPILKFLNNLRVAFDNNQAEWNIRMMKLQQKISGLSEV